MDIRYFVSCPMNTFMIDSDVGKLADGVLRAVHVDIRNILFLSKKCV